MYKRDVFLAHLDRESFEHVLVTCDHIIKWIQVRYLDSYPGVLLTYDGNGSFVCVSAAQGVRTAEKPLLIVENELKMLFGGNSVHTSDVRGWDNGNNYRVYTRVFTIDKMFIRTDSVPSNFQYDIKAIDYWLRRVKR